MVERVIQMINDTRIIGSPDIKETTNSQAEITIISTGTAVHTCTIIYFMVWLNYSNNIIQKINKWCIVIKKCIDIKKYEYIYKLLQNYTRSIKVKQNYDCSS